MLIDLLYYIMIPSQIFPIISVSLILSAFTYLLTPNLAKKLKRMKIVGIDVHKTNRPKIAEMGGLAIILSMTLLITFVYMFTSIIPVLIVLGSTLIFGLYGVFDDILRLGKYQKLFLSSIMGFILLVPLNPVAIMIPLLLFLTIGIGNIFNIFAGFNGLEIGCTSLIAFFFSMLCLVTGNFIPFLLSFGVFLILVGFLGHNKFPAKVFPGNVGTMTIGGFFAGICLYYNLYHLLVPLLFLHIADISLKAISAGYFSSNEKKPTKINGDNVLVPGNDYLSLSRLVLKFKPMNEKQLVNFFWVVLILFGSGVVFFTGAFL